MDNSLRTALFKLDTQKINLGGVNTYSLLKAPFATEARSRIKNLAVKVAQMKNQNYSKLAISETIDKNLNEIKEDYRNGFDEYGKKVVSDYNEQAQKKVSPKYDDPMGELLRRQDINQKIALMGDDDLAGYISELPADVSTYELNQLEIAAKGNHSQKATFAINAFKSKQPRAYEKDPDFKAAATKAAELKTIVSSGSGSKYIWSEEGKPMVGIENEFKASLDE